MSERPIIFSGPMVRAILEGRKTQTRRVLKPQPDAKLPIGGADFIPTGGSEIWYWLNGFDGSILARFSAPCRLGDTLWVRETWADNEVSPDCAEPEDPKVIFRADVGDTAKSFARRESGSGRYNQIVSRWRTPIYMPRWASRLTLRVTDVRVQRVQEISEGDAFAEGVEPDLQCCGNPDIEYDLSDHGEPINPRQGDCCGSPILASDQRETFRDLWNSINAKRGFGWDENPWVAAITFEVVK